MALLLALNISIEIAFGTELVRLSDSLAIYLLKRQISCLHFR